MVLRHSKQKDITIFLTEVIFPLFNFFGRQPSEQSILASCRSCFRPDEPLPVVRYPSVGQRDNRQRPDERLVRRVARQALPSSELPLDPRVT